MRRISLFALVSVLGLPVSAAAQESIFDIPKAQQVSFADLGIAAVSRQTYVGSDQSNTTLLPYINAQYKGRYFINPGLGLGAYAIRNKNIRLAGSVHYSLGRDGLDTPLTDEAFDIEGGFTANLSGRLYTPIAAIDVIGNIPISGGLDGFRVDTLATTQFHIFDKTIRVTPGIRATFHSSDYLNALYGISNKQVSAVSSPSLSPVEVIAFESEVSTLGVHTAAYLNLTEDVQLTGIINYSQLIGEVDGTALSPNKSGLTAAIAIARKF